MSRKTLGEAWQIGGWLGPREGKPKKNDRGGGVENDVGKQRPQ